MNWKKLLENTIIKDLKDDCKSLTEKNCMLDEGDFLDYMVQLSHHFKGNGYQVTEFQESSNRTYFVKFKGENYRVPWRCSCSNYTGDMVCNHVMEVKKFLASPEVKEYGKTVASILGLVK